jgi:hypothetical protein
MHTPIDNASWVYLAVEVAFLAGWGFLHIYFRVMWKLGLDWASL